MPASDRRILAALCLAGPASGTMLGSIVGQAVDAGRYVRNVPLVAATDDGLLEAHSLWVDHVDTLVSPADRDDLRRAAVRASRRRTRRPVW